VKKKKHVRYSRNKDFKMKRLKLMFKIIIYLKKRNKRVESLD
jgi:hypothetical protein